MTTSYQYLIENIEETIRRISNTCSPAEIERLKDSISCDLAEIRECDGDKAYENARQALNVFYNQYIK